MKRFEDTQMELILFSDGDVIATSTVFDGEWDDFGGNDTQDVYGA